MITENGRIKVYLLEGYVEYEGMVFQRLYSNVGLAEKALTQLESERHYRDTVVYSIRAVLLDGGLNDTQIGA